MIKSIFLYLSTLEQMHFQHKYFRIGSRDFLCS